jgi:hypothetical protein
MLRLTRITFGRKDLVDQCGVVAIGVVEVGIAYGFVAELAYGLVRGPDLELLAIDRKACWRVGRPGVGSCHRLEPPWRSQGASWSVANDARLLLSTDGGCRALPLDRLILAAQAHTRIALGAKADGFERCETWSG